MSETKLLTPDDEITKARIARKHRGRWTKKQFVRRQLQLKKLTCEHLLICYSRNEFYFKCKECGEKLVYAEEDEYQMFCKFVGLSTIDLLEN